MSLFFAKEEMKDELWTARRKEERKERIWKGRKKIKEERWIFSLFFQS